MGDTGTGERAKQAGRSVYAASQRAGRASAAAAGGAGRFVHRLTGASGAGRTGLSNLIELSAAGGVGDAFVAVALAGTLFFSTSVDQARGRAALALLITIAPYAILAPLIGPLLDRVKQGNRYILMGTLLARGLLCWGDGWGDSRQRHATACRVRRARPPEGLRRHQGRRDASAAAVGDHAGHRQRAG